MSVGVCVWYTLIEASHMNRVRLSQQNMEELSFTRCFKVERVSIIAWRVGGPV